MPVRNTYSPYKFGGRKAERPADLSPHCTDDEWMDGWIGGPHGQSRSNGGLDFGVQQQAIDDGIQSFPHPYSPLSPTFSPLVMALLADLFSHGRGKQVCTTLQ